MVLGPVACPSLIGRADELRELVARRLSAARGHGGLVLVAGSAGIGKTRLIRAFRGTLTGGRARFGIGYCSPSGNVPYAPLIEALTPLGCTPPLAPARTREDQIAALRDSIVQACSRHNAVLVLEDIHWADAATLNLLLRCLPSLESQRLLIVITYRSDELSDGAPIVPLIGQLTRYATSILLEPLKDEEMRRLLRGALGSNQSLHAHELDEIVQRAEGNPFFAQELLKNVLEHGTGADALPLTIRAAVHERLARLDAEALHVARSAAILGRSFQADVLARVCDRAFAEVLAALSRLREFQIVEERRAQPNSFTFRHALTRDVIYGTMLESEVRPVHARVLHMLEMEGNARAYDLGYHARMAGDAGRCVLYNERAGGEAEAVHAYADAVRCYEHAQELAPQPGIRCRLLAKAAAALSSEGKAEHALKLYAAAIAAAEDAGDGTRVAELRCAMAAEARRAGDCRRATSTLTQALDDATLRDGAVRARLSLNLAVCKLDQNDCAAARALIAGASQASGTPLYWAAASYAAAVGGDVAGVREASAHYIALCTSLGQGAALQARFNFAFNLCVLGADAEALAIFDATLPDLHALRLSSLELLACADAALIHARRGNVDEARKLVERGLAIPEPSSTAPITLAAAALSVASVLGNDELVARAVPESIVAWALRCGIDSALGRIAGPYARWLSLHGDPRAARALLARAIRTLRGPFGATETLLAAMELGSDATASAALELAPRAQALRDVPLYAATVAHMRAVDAYRARDDAAKTYAADAERLYKLLGWPLHAARCAQLRGDARAARDRRRRDADRLRGGPTLSARETQIAQLVARGASNRSLAARFTISERTVERHLTSIYRKLRLRNRTQLVAFIAHGEASAHPKPVAFL